MSTKKKIITDYTVYTLIIVLGIALDRLTKRLAVRFLRPVTSFPVIEDVLHFTFVRNSGAAFGMLSDHRWIFMTVSTVAIIAMTVFLYMRKAPSMLYAASIAAIVSGGIGNMIDRVAYGYVVDFIDVQFIDFAVFNVADCFVTVGAVCLVILLIADLIKDTASKKNGR